SLHDALPISLAGKVIQDIVFRGDGYAVARGWAEAPILDRLQHFFLNSIADGSQNPGFDYIAFRIDRDLHDHVALYAIRHCRTQVGRVGKVHWDGRPDIRSTRVSFRS